VGRRSKYVELFQSDGWHLAAMEEPMVAVL
jgi:hypothetical protein